MGSLFKGHYQKSFMFIFGLFFMEVGVALVTKSDLETSLIASVPFVRSMIFPVTIRQFTLIVSLLFLLMQIMILRKNF